MAWIIMEYIYVDLYGQTWVVDFQLSGVLPTSFMNYTINIPILRVREPAS